MKGTLDTGERTVARPILAILFVAITACAESTAPTQTPAEPDESARDVIMARTLVEFAKGGPVHITFVTDNDIIIRPITSQVATPAGALALASCEDPICAVSADAGTWAMRSFMRCIESAREKEVCGDGGGDFHLEWDDDAGENGEIHIHCRGDCNH